MRFLPLLCALVALAAAPSAQPAFMGGAPPPDPDRLVTWTGPADPVALAPGGTATATLSLEVAEGWHVYALDSPLGIPLRVGARSLPDGVHTGGLRQSEPVDAVDPSLGEPVRWFDGPATVGVDLAASADAAAGRHEAVFEVRFGVCDDQICLPPQTRTVAVPLLVEAGTATAVPVEAPDPLAAGQPVVEMEPVELDPVGTAPLAGGDEGAPIAEGAAAPVRGGGDESLAGFLLLAVGAGLAALLTPCVFPLVPLTVGAFSHDASRGRAVGRALGFGAAVVAVFTALGAAASIALGAAGAQQVAADPWVNLALGLAFVVFALALLGLVELRLPSSWANRLDGASRRRGGLAGTLLAAVALAVVSFSCTAPFVGGLLATAATGGWARPLLGMTAFSAAFATPFVVLAAAPGLAARLPRSGAWMTTLKGTLGFVELAAALKFLSNADLVWGVGLLTRPVVVALTMAVAGLAVLFLLGRLRLGSDDASASVGAGRLLGAVGALAVVLLLAPGLTGAPVPHADAFLPPPPSAPPSENAPGETVLTWYTDNLEAAREAARASGKPLFIDFTGYTCTNCRAMESSVFPHPAVAPVLAGRFVRARLFTDARPNGPAFQTLQQEMTGTVAMPTYAVLSPSGDVLGVWSGMASPAEFAAFLDRSTDPLASDV